MGGVGESGLDQEMLVLGSTAGKFARVLCIQPKDVRDRVEEGRQKPGSRSSLEAGNCHHLTAIKNTRV